MMDWQQKLAAIKAFAGDDVSLCMRSPGNWYVSVSMYIGGDGFLRGSYGNGCTPEEAVDAHWKIYSTLPPESYARSPQS
jgi:hypothetical protein